MPEWTTNNITAMEDAYWSAYSPLIHNLNQIDWLIGVFDVIDNKSGAEVGAQESTEIKQLPIKAYLDQQLMPLLLEALGELSKEKPEEPIEFVAKYLLDHNPEKNWA